MKQVFQTLAVVCVACLLSAPIGAQGFLKKAAEKAKEKVSDATHQTQNTGSQQSESTQSNTQDGNSGNEDKSVGAAIAAPANAAPANDEHPKPSSEKRQYYPSLSFATVLNGVKIEWRSGGIQLDNIQATFVDEGAEGYTILRTAGGDELYRYDWRAQLVKKPFSLLDIIRITDLKTGQSVPGWAPLKKKGDFVLDFYLPAEHFYSFPFKVSVLPAANAFSGEDWWVTEGDWDNWAYLLIPDNNPEQNLMWKMWLRRRTRTDQTEVHQDCRIKVEIKGKNGVVCVNRDATHSLGPNWVRWEFDMAFPSEKKGDKTTWNQYFKSKDLLKNDGDYTVNVSIDDKPYGVWKFSVKNGKLTYTGRSDRASANPLSFIEGGLDAWWYERSK